MKYADLRAENDRLRDALESLVDLQNGCGTRSSHSRAARGTHPAHCPVHPNDTIGHYGCPACNSRQQWARDQRAAPTKPRREGGR